MDAGHGPQDDASGHLGETQLTIGAATGIIPFRKGSILTGYPNYKDRLARGQHDELEVDALLIKDRSMEILLLSADVIGLKRADVQLVKQRITAQMGIPPERILLTCSHTHSSGSTIWFQKGEENRPDESFINDVLKTIEHAAIQASEQSVPVSLKVATGEADLGHNRRVCLENKAINEWKDPDHVHTGPVDREVGIITFVDEAGTIRAMLLNYSCHPVALGPENYLASADFPGYARESLRQAIGPVPILYATGAAGDINPYEALQADNHYAREMGNALARSVMCALEETSVIEHPNLSCRYEVASFKRSHDNQEVETDFQLFTFGDDLAIIALPGEPFVEIGLNLKHQSRFPRTFVFGYSNDYHAYLLTKKALREGGYEARISFSDDIEDFIINLGTRWL